MDYPHERLILFGSRARGDARSNSDLDILILDEPPTDLARLALARERGHRSLFPYRVDLVLATTAPCELVERALAEGMDLPHEFLDFPAGHEVK